MAPTLTPRINRAQAGERFTGGGGVIVRPSGGQNHRPMRCLKTHSRRGLVITRWTRWQHLEARLERHYLMAARRKQ